MAASAGIDTAPILIGHSMGGAVCVNAALRRDHEIKGPILIEYPVHIVPDAELDRRRRRSLGNHRRYPSFEAAVADFRSLPESGYLRTELTDNVARRSVRETPDGWIWKFDRSIFGQEIDLTGQPHSTELPGGAHPR